MLAPLSVVVITRNVASQIGACLDSVRFADEIVIVDSGSSDATLDIARSYGARVLHQEWLGYGKQKQFAVNEARHDWVLCLDADERVSEALRASIQTTLANPHAHAYAMKRCNRFMGRWLRHGEGYPDWSVRLFQRQHARWSEDAVHEKVIVNGALGRLQGDLLHESENGLHEYLAKQNNYTTLQAQLLHARGKRTGILKLSVSPVFRFLKFYLLRLGFLDGVPGLVHISIGCWNSFMKYAKLRQLSPRHPR